MKLKDASGKLCDCRILMKAKGNFLLNWHKANYTLSFRMLGKQKTTFYKVINVEMRLQTMDVW
jgi:hypothetical protein